MRTVTALRTGREACLKVGGYFQFVWNVYPLPFSDFSFFKKISRVIH